jgi:predicted peptidase
MKSLFLALTMLVALTGIVYGREPETGFLNRTVKVKDVAYRYQVYVPPNWNKKEKWPIVLFLHGAGERGDDGLLQTEIGIGTAIRKKAERFPAIIVFPQCRKDLWWPQEEMQAQAMAAFEQSLKEFNGDPARAYLTGISMGGYGTWALATKYPGKFVALAPVCGGIKPPSARIAALAVSGADGPDPYRSAAVKVGTTPVWIFHGGADPVVPPDESRKMNEALKAAGGNVKYTEYEGVGHNSWDRAYADPELMTWLLAQRRK